MSLAPHPAPENAPLPSGEDRSEEHTSELQSQSNLVCRLLLEKKKKQQENLDKPEEIHTDRHDGRSAASWCVCRRLLLCALMLVFFFFNDTATTEIYTLSLHDALPISGFVA